MDLLQTVRKEGSRGGRGDFKWDDVKADQHREHYLGHSLMAPVGRWQRGRDLSWYSKASDSSSESARQAARKEELRRIKEAEDEAMAAALGLPVVKSTSTNPNTISLHGDGDVKGEGNIKKVVDDVAHESAVSGKGLGFGSYGGVGAPDNEDEVLPGSGRGRESKRQRVSKGDEFSIYDRKRNREDGGVDVKDERDWDRSKGRRRRRDSEYSEDGRDARREYERSRRRLSRSSSRSRSRSRTRYRRTSRERRYRNERSPERYKRSERYSNGERNYDRTSRKDDHKSRRTSNIDEERYRSRRKRSESPPERHERTERHRY